MIFTPAFSQLDPQQAHRTLAADGYLVVDRALEPRFAAALEAELGGRPLALNVNDVGPVRYHHQTYFTHALAASKAFFDLATHSALRAICRAHLGSQFRLKCQRYYQSGLHHELTWHTDDKTPEGRRTGVAGIGAVIYLEDTFFGELQVLARSHLWSAATGRTEFTEDEIATRHAGDVITISRSAGALILFDSQTLHRTRPITEPGLVRKSVFLQVDADIDHGEKIIVDTQFVDPGDAELLLYLGMGRTSGYPSMPPSSLSTLTNSDLRNLARTALATLAGRKLALVRQAAAALRRRLPRSR